MLLSPTWTLEAAVSRTEFGLSESTDRGDAGLWDFVSAAQPSAEAEDRHAPCVSASDPRVTILSAVAPGTARRVRVEGALEGLVLPRQPRRLQNRRTQERAGYRPACPAGSPFLIHIYPLPSSR